MGLESVVGFKVKQQGGWWLKRHHCWFKDKGEYNNESRCIISNQGGDY